MDLVTLKQFAESQGITYEAVRRQVIRYEEKLSGHIYKQNGVQYLDEEAVTFLKERRRASPIVLQTIDQKEAIDQLKEQIEKLRVQLMTVQSELIKEKDRVIELQEESRKTIEARSRYTALLEENEAKDAKLRDAESRIGDLQKLRDDDQKTIEDLRKERDEAQTETQSFKRSLFGFYRKR